MDEGSLNVYMQAWPFHELSFYAASFLMENGYCQVVESLFCPCKKEGKKKTHQKYLYLEMIDFSFKNNSNCSYYMPKQNTYYFHCCFVVLITLST